MEFVAIAIAVLTIAVIVGVSKTYEVGDDLARIAPGTATYVSVRTALTEPKLSKTEIEKEIYEMVKADDGLKGTSREDIRAVLSRLAVLYGGMTDEQAVAQARSMRNW